MKLHRFPFIMFVLVPVAVAVAALGIAPALTAPKKPMPMLSITLTDTAIMTKPSSLAAGDHTVTVKNMTATPRGVEITGVDRGGTVYVRYTKILPKGKSESFKWYFPTNHTAYVKDLLKCEHAANTCVIATFGMMRKAIHVK